MIIDTDIQNQMTADQLNQFFGSIEWPLFKSVEYDCQADGDLLVKYNIYVGEKINYFDGHFPDQAVLPGVVQVHWVGQLARKCLACEGFKSLKRLKFNSVLLPATNLSLTLIYKPQKGVLKFSFQDQLQKYSSGSLTFQSAV